MALNEKGEYIWEFPRVDCPTLCDRERTIPTAMNFYCPRYTVNRMYGTRAFLPDGTRGEYEWMSYVDVVRASAELAAGFTALGLRAGDKMAIFSSVRSEWMLTDWACHSAGLVVCPLYDSLAVDELEANVRTAEVSAIMLTLDTLPTFHALVERGVVFEHVILMDDRLDDRAFVMRHRPELAPAWVSTTLKDHATMEQLHSIWEVQFNELEVAKHGREGPYPTFDDLRTLPGLIEADQSEFRTPDDLAADPECGRFREYAPAPYVAPRTVRNLNDDRADPATFESAVGLITGTFSSVRELGRRSEHLPAGNNDLSKVPVMPVLPEQKPTDVCSFVFTSGSTGTPKAAMVTHIGLLSSAMGLSARGDVTPTRQLWPRNPDDYFIAYLPTAHVFARALSVRGLQSCEFVGFFRGSVPELFPDIGVLRPTIMPCVPRILQRVYDLVMATVDRKPAPVRFLFHRQLKARINRFYGVNTTADESESLLDRKILGVVKEKFGGRVRLMYSGSAPLPVELGRFFQCTVTPNLIEGYASSETSSGGAVQYQGTRIMGHIGAPLADFEAKVIAVPELGYDPAHPENPEIITGELCMRGVNVFSGYYNAPEATADVLDAEGWFHTGDVVSIYTNPPVVGASHGAAAGPYIKIIDRKKSVMKLSQGEFVATENVQGALNAARYCGQVFVGGSSEESYILAVVVPDEATFVPAARKLIDPGSEEDVTPEVVARYCRDPRAIALVHREIVAEARKIGLKGFEVPKAVLLEPVAWTPENGLATPSMKLRSAALKKKYTPALLSAYSRLHAQNADGGRAFDPDFAAAAGAVAGVLEF